MRISSVPVRLCFESALELMSTTQIGTFQVKPCFHTQCLVGPAHAVYHLSSKLKVSVPYPFRSIKHSAIKVHAISY